ncbi:uncharacterized protein LOC135104793 [Scylla paramamosain]|uniref:uncharacterized protein LOC135104793 n=1 Tax=Scylla paramamosain TaxID=85552 RepID=UPI00308336F7
MFRPTLFLALVVVGLAASLTTEDHAITEKLQGSSLQSKASSMTTRLINHSSGSRGRMEQPTLRARPSQHELDHEQQVEDDLYTIRIIIIIIIVFVIILVILVLIIVAFMFQISRAADKIAANGSS